MKDSTKIKTLLVSTAIILGASAAASVGTYALFSDSVTLINHFVSGNVNLTLKRTNLAYTYIDSEGMQKAKTDSTVVDFSEPTEENLFGLKSTDKFVPTDYREATMELSNTSTLAYDWYLTLALTSDSNKFAEQLLLQVDTDPSVEGYEYQAYLSAGLNVGSATEPIGLVKVGSTATFKVKVSFVDNTSNNDAQDKSVDFDMTVYATQHVAVS